MSVRHPANQSAGPQHRRLRRQIVNSLLPWERMTPAHPFVLKYGFLRVSERRWRAAQAVDLAQWSDAPRSQTTDRNEHHAALFDGYKALPSALGHVVELGCGPYTQLQSILRDESTTRRITLVDWLERRIEL